MNRTTILVAFVAALAGGVISRYVSPAPVQAQGQNPAAAELRAQRFVFVNPNGSVVATFMVDQPKGLGPGDILIQPSVRLLDGSGKEIWSAGGNPMRRLALK